MANILLITYPGFDRAQSPQNSSNEENLLSTFPQELLREIFKNFESCDSIAQSKLPVVCKDWYQCFSDNFGLSLFNKIGKALCGNKFVTQGPFRGELVEAQSEKLIEYRIKIINENLENVFENENLENVFELKPLDCLAQTQRLTPLRLLQRAFQCAKENVPFVSSFFNSETKDGHIASGQRTKSNATLSNPQSITVFKITKVNDNYSIEITEGGRKNLSKVEVLALIESVFITNRNRVISSDQSDRLINKLLLKQNQNVLNRPQIPFKSPNIIESEDAETPKLPMIVGFRSDLVDPQTGAITPKLEQMIVFK